MRERRTPQMQSPWLPHMANFAGAALPAAGAIMAFQKYWIDSAAAGMRGIQAITKPQSVLELSGKEGREGEVLKSAQGAGAAILDANMKAFELYFQGIPKTWTAMVLASQAANPSLSRAVPAAPLQDVTKVMLDIAGKAQDTMGQAWPALQKRLAEGLDQWNAATA